MKHLLFACCLLALTGPASADPILDACKTWLRDPHTSRALSWEVGFYKGQCLGIIAGILAAAPEICKPASVPKDSVAVGVVVSFAEFEPRPDPEPRFELLAYMALQQTWPSASTDRPRSKH
jgi:hypothetical protein